MTMDDIQSAIRVNGYVSQGVPYQEAVARVRQEMAGEAVAAQAHAVDVSKVVNRTAKKVYRPYNDWFNQLFDSLICVVTGLMLLAWTIVGLFTINSAEGQGNNHIADFFAMVIPDALWFLYTRRHVRRLRVTRALGR